MSHIAGRGAAMRNIAAHQAMHVRQQAAAIAQRNNRHMLMQQNLRLARSAFATVVRELTEAQPTADELELLIEVVQEAEEQNLAPERSRLGWRARDSGGCCKPWRKTTCAYLPI